MQFALGRFESPRWLLGKPLCQGVRRSAISPMNYDIPISIGNSFRARIPLRLARSLHPGPLGSRPWRLSFHPINNASTVAVSVLPRTPLLACRRLWLVAWASLLASPNKGSVGLHGSRTSWESMQAVDFPVDKYSIRERRREVGGFGISQNIVDSVSYSVYTRCGPSFSCYLPLFCSNWRVLCRPLQS